LWLRRGDDRQAQEMFGESLRLWRAIGHMAGIAHALAGLGGMAAARGQAEQAGRLFGAARTVCPPTDPFVSAVGGADLDQRIAQARTSLDAAAFEKGWTAGRSLPLDAVIGAALDM
jgi:nickel-dependent lactate racemase